MNPPRWLGRPSRRRCLLAAAAGAVPALAADRALADAAEGGSRMGFAGFSSHQHWKAAREGRSGVKFTDALGFFDHARELGGDGVQASLRGRDLAFAAVLRARVEESGGYFEGDIALPPEDAGLDEFAREVDLVLAAGAKVARCVLTGRRRYETFASREEFLAFRRQAERRLAAALPLAERRRLKLAVENHKDLLAEELAELLDKFSSEWLGATVDTGNNLALLEDASAAVDLLAPRAFTVHLKDMALQPAPEGFLLSEVPFGQGFLDLPGIALSLRRANPDIVFNIEMATRDPLLVPCQSDAYWASFPGRDHVALEAALERVRRHPAAQAPPSVSGKPLAQVLEEEEANNRRCAAARPLLPLES